MTKSFTPAHIHRVVALSVLVCALGVAGCRSTKPPIMPMGTTASLAPQDEYGVVIIGQGMTWEKSLLGGSFIKACDYFHTVWAPLDTNLPVNEQQMFWATESGCQNTTPLMRYSVVKVPPGKYGLHYIEHKRWKTILRTALFEPIENPKYADFKGPKFTIQKGEVLYIGDLTYTPAEKQLDVYTNPYRVKIKSVERNDAAARNALGEYKGIAQNMQFRAMLER